MVSHMRDGGTLTRWLTQSTGEVLFSLLAAAGTNNSLWLVGAMMQRCPVSRWLHADCRKRRDTDRGQTSHSSVCLSVLSSDFLSLSDSVQLKLTHFWLPPHVAWVNSHDKVGRCYFPAASCSPVSVFLNELVLDSWSGSHGAFCFVAYGFNWTQWCDDHSLRPVVKGALQSFPCYVRIVCILQVLRAFPSFRKTSAELILWSECNSSCIILLFSPDCYFVAPSDPQCKCRRASGWRPLLCSETQVFFFLCVFHLK